MLQPLKIGILGVGGRMGQMLVQQSLATADTHLVGGTERAKSPNVGRDIGLACGLEPVGVSIGDDAEALVKIADALTDFTTPEAAATHAALAAKHKKIFITGTTGLTPEQQAAIAAAAKETVIIQSMNFSLGLNLLLSLVEQAAKKLDIGYDVEILEFHHNLKVDAPSGTAHALGQAVAAGRGVRFEDVALFSRKGQVGARKPGDIGIAALRGGDMIGDHHVYFAGEGEVIELAHRSTSRHIYALGVLHAALWARGKAAGLYSMRDVLGIKG